MSKVVCELKNCLGKNLAESISETLGKNVRKSCGGKGICKSCEVELLEGSVKYADIEITAPAKVRSCLSFISSDFAKISIKSVSLNNAIDIEDTFKIISPFTPDTTAPYSVAVDIGTTTVAIIASDKNGNILKTQTCLNGQVKYADDVLSRIDFCRDKEKLIVMQRALTDDISSILKEIDLPIKKMFVAGNTTMLHIFCGEDPTTLGKSPFTPVFLESRNFSSKSLFSDLPEFEVVTLPSISAYIGADLNAGLCVLDAENQNCNFLLIDIGTNGEIIFKINGQYFSASAAAGPAFEGHNLHCGSRACAGAISKIYFEDGLKFSTIEDANPVGICGSAYIDFLAVARKNNILENSGRFSASADTKILDNIGKVFYINENIFISESDIANLLKAKAAIFSAVATLMDELKIKSDSIDKIFIAGGFGKNINMQNAINCGLIADFEISKISFIGNSSLAGAYLCALDSKIFESSKNYPEKIKNVDLNLSEFFEDNFIDALFLE